MKAALLHVSLPAALCLAVAASGLFDSVAVELGYEHYAETPVPGLPAWLAMPCNSLVNVGYIALGLFWLRAERTSEGAAYMKDVFASMAIAYGPVQWARLATFARLPAVLDQWFTLPIFAWVPVWCRYITHGWQPRLCLAAELCSLGSFALALLHDRGFEAALGLHIALAAGQGLRVQRRQGDALSRRYLCLALLSCAGFVALKLLDLPLARYRGFRRLSGHFWSKVCDVLQFHYSFRFLTHLTRAAERRAARAD
ncbi:transmembrane protein 187 [Lepisosteus oculatus]|nr:PREDICTED: transmembrane protein 187 [Lepisosteus oculatus]